MTPRPRFAWAALLSLAALLPLAARARAAEAPADSTVEGYVRSMADSTDAWFGLSAQPADTTGIDSTRAWALANPRRRPVRRGLGVSFSPAPGFNRVLGPAYGAGISAGSESGFGRVSGAAQWAAGAHQWFGNGGFERRWADALEARTWRVRVRAGRWCTGMDRDFFAPGLSTLRAWLLGNDRSHYLRTDGVRLDASHTTPGWDAGVSGRDMLESPMRTTATWYLTGHRPRLVNNLAATPVRLHEAGAWLTLRPAHTNLELGAHVWRAGGGLGGDADYTRLRASAGHALALGRHLTLASQADYGRLTGTALPQDAFFFGGTRLYTVGENSVHGTGRALGSVELMLVDPLQRVMHVTPTPAFPVQLGVFAASGACWGIDPASGDAQLTARDWPEARTWRSEAGVSLMYRPGLPDPDTFVRIALAWPLGPGPNRTGIGISYTRALEFLRR